MKAKAKARLTFEVEIDLDSTWGGDCTVEQVTRQANVEAKNLAAHIVARMKDGSEKIPIRMSLINIDQRIIVELGP